MNGKAAERHQAIRNLNFSISAALTTPFQKLNMGVARGAFSDARKMLAAYEQFNPADRGNAATIKAELIGAEQRFRRETDGLNNRSAVPQGDRDALLSSSHDSLKLFVDDLNALTTASLRFEDTIH